MESYYRLFESSSRMQSWLCQPPRSCCCSLKQKWVIKYKKDSFMTFFFCFSCHLVKVYYSIWLDKMLTIFNYNKDGVLELVLNLNKYNDLILSLKQVLVISMEYWNVYQPKEKHFYACPPLLVKQWNIHVEYIPGTICDHS